MQREPPFQRSFLVRTSETLATAIDAEAARRGMSGAALIRDVLTAALGAGDGSDRKRSPPRRPRPRLAAAEADLRALVRQLGRATAAIGAEPKEVDFLRELRALVADTAALVGRIR